MPEKKNPLVEIYKGVSIYKYNELHIRVDSETKKMLIDQSEITGLSVREILGYSSKHCDNCKGVNVIAYNSKEKKVGIPRAILYKSLLKKNSGSL
jgi:hypothetical protein